MDKEWCLDPFQFLTFAINFSSISRIKSKKGKPCNSTSNQSIGFMPVDPPNIHLSLPQIWGSGKKGASPKLRHKRMIIFQLLKRSFNLSNFLNKVFNGTCPLRSQMFYKGRSDYCTFGVFSGLLKCFGILNSKTYNLWVLQFHCCNAIKVYSLNFPKTCF